ncbi:MAG: hypothetical protein ACRC37_02905, partial [Lentisphaeria bacterium]
MAKKKMDLSSFVQQEKSAQTVVTELKTGSSFCMSREMQVMDLVRSGELQSRVKLDQVAIDEYVELLERALE